MRISGWLFLINLLLQLASLFGSEKGFEEDFSWPLEILTEMTSNFGEVRFGAAHAGLDFSTHGRTGYEVYAIADGIIYRMKVEKRGYGRALYIRHKNDLISVYAHLERFEDKVLGLEDILKKEQQLKGRYPGNIYVEIPVKKGQLIAYSGETGAGLPHLHFELRRTETNPINPMQFKRFKIQDHTPPVITEILLEPLGPNSFVNRERKKICLPLTPSSNSEIVSNPANIFLQGKIRFYISAKDYSIPARLCGIYNLKAFLDNQLFFELSMDEFSYDISHQFALIYDFYNSRLTPFKSIYKLFRQKGNELFKKEKSQDLPFIDTEKYASGAHNLKIIASDYSWNSSTALLKLIFERSAPETYLPTNDLVKEDQNIPLSVNDELEMYPDFAVYKIISSKKLADINGSFIQPGCEPVPLGFRIIKPWIYESCLIYQMCPSNEAMVKVNAFSANKEKISLSKSFSIFPVSCFKGNNIKTDEYSLNIEPDGLYEDTFIWVEKTKENEVAGLKLVTPLFHFKPSGLAFNKRAKLTLNIPSQVKFKQKVGLFYRDQIRKSWIFVGRDGPEDNNYNDDYILYLADYALLQDISPPRPISPFPKENTIISGKSPQIYWVIEEIGMGVDDENSQYFLDGKRIECEFDPDRDRLYGLVDGDLNPGLHTHYVIVSDYAGNLTKSKVASFSVK